MKAQTPIDLALLRRRFAPLLSAWQRQAQRIERSLREGRGGALRAAFAATLKSA